VNPERPDGVNFAQSRPRQAQPKLIGWRMAVHETRALLLTMTVCPSPLAWLYARC
jgi:hypothetical protein